MKGKRWLGIREDVKGGYIYSEVSEDEGVGERRKLVEMTGAN